MTPSLPGNSEAPSPLWRRVARWRLVQVKHVLPPTVFFFGFNLILFTRWMTLEEHGIPFTNFLAATLRPKRGSRGANAFACSLGSTG